ncbi:MAG: YggT family protein [Clostridia bacterium]|nr:YggT family protein [Clostridia bacterium]
MPTVLTVVTDIVVLLLLGIQIAMMLRAILSWFPIDSNKFVDFLYAITEPFIVPIRLLFEKLGWFQNLPIDISFMVSYLLLSLLSFVLAM